MICLCHCCWTFHCTHGGGHSPGRAAGTRVPRCQPEARCGRGHGGVCSLSSPFQRLHKPDGNGAGSVQT